MTIAIADEALGLMAPHQGREPTEEEISHVTESVRLQHRYMDPRCKSGAMGDEAPTTCTML